VYTRLRKDPVQSQRERDTMKQIKVNRKFYDLKHELKADGFPRFEEVDWESKAENVMVAVLFKVKSAEAGEELAKWYDEEHIPLLSKVPGWRRSRRFVSSYVEPPADPTEVEYLALHDLAPENGLYHSAEYKAATNTPWRTKVLGNAVQGPPARRVYNLYYTFGPASRDLASLTDSSTTEFTSNDGLTHTVPSPAPSATISSFITTSDGVHIPYSLSGNPDPNAPLILLINSILVNHEIWDAFLTSFFSHPSNQKYRILRYNSRGRSTLPSSTYPVTMDLLASDAVTLLDAFRVPKAALVMGVSLGAATAVNVALKYPDRVAKFIACDTNSFAPPSNPKAWDERIAMAEKEGALISSAPLNERLGAQEGENVVGQDLAEATVRRWFVEKSYADAEKEKLIKRVKEMVATNSLEGFKNGVKALYEYDFRDDMAKAEVPGLFVVGAGDGVLPKTMRGMAERYGDGRAGLKEIPDAGHLPMVEQPEKVAEVVTEFLGQ
jgi:pimeloyl-ACP methyl ester carboxylesterase